VSLIRRLNSKSKKTFIFFGVGIVGILAVFGFVLYQVSLFEKYNYDVKANSFTYDENYNAINITNNGVVSKKWDGKYYLTFDNSKIGLR
jgi:hypothetical protein